MKTLLSLTIVLFLLGGCNGGKEHKEVTTSQATKEFNFQTLLQTMVSGIKQPKEKEFVVIHDKKALRAFYPKISQDILDGVDFMHETLLGVYGGDDIRIVSIEDSDPCIQVHVQLKQFEETSPFYGIPYSPIYLAKIKKKEKCFQFDQTVELVR